LNDYHQANLIALDEVMIRCTSEKDQQPNIKGDLTQSKFENQLNPKATIGGQLKATISSAAIFHGADGKCLTTLQESETVVLMMTMVCNDEIRGLLAGFTIKDRLGQKIIEENNSLFLPLDGSEIVAKKGAIITVKFDYKIPRLMLGKYSVDFAVAEGTQKNHVPQCWVYDALQFESVPKQEVFGLMSIEPPKFSFKELHD
jgi:lipopolysaccharide transport system ATP-binding protein